MAPPVLADGAVKITSIDVSSPLGKRAIDTALPSFQQQQFDIRDFDIFIYKNNRPSTLSVLFRKRGAPSSLRGSSEEYPSFEVELTSDGSRLIKSHYSR